MTTAVGAPVQILLVEDSPGDVSLTREALLSARIANELSVVGDGAEALAFLRQQGPYAEAPRPDLVLLDLNLPGIDGRTVLATMKEDDDLKTIPVIVLTTSAAEEDISRSYQDHANCYITKPVDFADFLTVISELEGFWLQLVKLPPHD